MTTKDRAIEFDSKCLYQPNAVELSNGVIVFDACGMCESCLNANRPTGSAAKDGQVIRVATPSEISRQEFTRSPKQMSAVEMFAIFREIKTPGFTYDSFVVSPITSDTPDSPDEVPGTRHWIEALVRLECDQRNAEVRREERREMLARQAESERLRVEKAERRRSVLKSNLVVRRISGGASVYRDRDREFMGVGRRVVVPGEVVYGYDTVANGWAAEVRPGPGQVAVLVRPGDEYSFSRWAVLDARTALDADILDDEEASLVSDIAG